MEPDRLAERRQMVSHQLQRGGINDRRVLEAFTSVPRHLFVPVEFRKLAYENTPLPIGFKQTISQPFIVAYMTQALQLTGNERVLEVGTGSGYQAAILSQLVHEVHTIERIAALSERAALILKELGVQNVHLHVGDGSLGWSEAAPYDAILVTAAAPQVPHALLEQLADHGRLILPVECDGLQQLELWLREGSDFSHEALLPVSFVLLKGREGYQPA